MMSHMALVYPRWALHRERLRDWMQSMYVLTTATGEAPPTWGWDFLVGSLGADSGLDGSWWLCGLVGR